MPYLAFPCELDERPQPGETPRALAERLAREKAQFAARQFPGDVALGADTVVALDGEPLGKPASSTAATAMLHRLRNRSHHVITAVAAARVDSGGLPATWVQSGITEVWMRNYSDAEVEAYVASGDPFDKAGAYAIQHPTFRPAERLDGCFLSVVGLPLPEVFRVLTAAGARLPRMDRKLIEGVCPACRDLAELPLS